MSPRGLRTAVIATTGMAVLVGALVLAGWIADALPAVITAVAGFFGVCVLIVMIAFREEGRR